MLAEPARTRSRQLLVLAVLAAVLGALWAGRTAPSPNSDRYDYLGRAHHVLEGEGPRPLVVYPLRLAFDGAEVLPPQNLTRPPLWPLSIAPALRLGAGDQAGVVVAALALLTLLPLVALAGDRSLGAGAGGFAALAVAASFATVRGLWGAGPELLLALLLFTAWTWNATMAGPLGGFGLGAILATLPWLHPIGWLYAGLGLLARVGRSSPRALAVAALTTVVLGLPWYLHVGGVTGAPLGPLQSQAELAKAVLDPGGLGPYRGLEPFSTVTVLTNHTGAWLHQAAWNAKELLVHLDGWLAWPLVLLALLGSRRDPTLARRDALLGLLAFVVVAQVARDPRLLLPLLPVACTWAGAGYREAFERWPRRVGPGLAALVVVLPWLLPLGATARPGQELDAATRTLSRPSPEAVRAVGAAGGGVGPVITDSAVLNWRARRVGVFLPTSPAVLETLLTRPALAGAEVLVLQTGVDGPWTASAREDWKDWLRPRRPHAPTGEPWILPLHPDGEGAGAQRRAPAEPYVPAPLSLGRDDRPDSLVTIPVPPASREGLRITPRTLDALLAMVAAAREENVHLRVISAYRSYERQESLYRRAIERHGPDQAWVAAPGTSEHQLGTTVDLADAAMEHVLERSFATTPEGRWLAAHAGRFGFVRSYTEANEERTGYRPEPWHYRHRPELFEDAPAATGEPGAPHPARTTGGGER